MFREAAEAPERIQHQLEADASLIEALGERLRQLRPRALITCARGSSDHAATFARYLIETRLGLLTASSPPSIASLYNAQRDLSQCVFLAISQSGASPDLLAAARSAKAGGALVIALVNAEDSPLAASADVRIPMRAGLETSVAATKSFLTTLSALVHLTARWCQEPVLLRALHALPAQLEAAWQLDWRPLVTALVPAQQLYVLGRGLGLAIAEEAALKLKETCGLYAQAYSSAEVRHGPIAVLDQGMPVLMFNQSDEARPALEASARSLAAEGLRVWMAGGLVAGVESLPMLTAHPAIEPLLMAQAFYRAAAELAVARGQDPDRPRRLEKATLTV
jgi:glucosamine--fructose-6-phosphate aminotransferase (isomerizing)